MGLTYDETMSLPLSELMDLISVQQIKAEGCNYKKPMTNDEELDAIFKLR
jgi:hypothetical protein